MPRFYFDFFDHKSTVDDHGVELIDLARAQLHATLILSEVIRDATLEADDVYEYAIHIRADGDQVLAVASAIVSVRHLS